MTKNKLKQIFCELYDQFSEEYDDSQILKATQAMYDLPGDNIIKLIILTVIIFLPVCLRLLIQHLMIPEITS